MTVVVPQYSRPSFKAGLVREIEQDIRKKYDVDVVLFLSLPADVGNDDWQADSVPALELVRLYVPAADRRQGLGSLVMNELCRHADAHGWEMSLTASARFGTNEIVLTDFYARFGFKLTGFSEDKEPMMNRPALSFHVV